MLGGYTWGGDEGEGDGVSPSRPSAQDPEGFFAEPPAGGPPAGRCDRAESALNPLHKFSVRTFFGTNSDAGFFFRTTGAGGTADVAAGTVKAGGATTGAPPTSPFGPTSPSSSSSSTFLFFPAPFSSIISETRRLIPPPVPAPVDCA